MASSHSVTDWIGQLRAGDQVAAQYLWGGYFRRLVGLARPSRFPVNVRSRSRDLERLPRLQERSPLPPDWNEEIPALTLVLILRPGDMSAPEPPCGWRQPSRAPALTLVLILRPGAASRTCASLWL